MARAPDPALRVTCPVAPSVNNLFVTYRGKVHGGRRKGPDYKRWLHDAGWLIKAQHPVAVPGIVRVLIEAPLNRRRDLDNALKATIDLIVKLALIDDDCWIDDLRIVRAGTGSDMTISIWPMADHKTVIALG